MTVGEGAAILRMPRRHFSHLVNHSDEGLECEPLVLTPRKDPRQLDMFDETDPKSRPKYGCGLHLCV
jgi:hypothetical protein